MEPSFKLLQLIGEILENISNKFTFTQIFIFFVVIGMAVAIFLPIMIKTL